METKGTDSKFCSKWKNKIKQISTILPKKWYFLIVKPNPETKLNFALDLVHKDSFKDKEHKI